MPSETAPPDKLYLDDLIVGDVFHSAGYRLEAKEIIAFAEQYDPQPFHLDAETAKDTFFQGLAASGWHTMAVTMRLIVESVPFANGIIGAGGEVAWPRPTRPGETLHVESKIIDIRRSLSKPHQAIVTVESLTLNQDGDTRQKFTARLLAFSRTANGPRGNDHAFL